MIRLKQLSVKERYEARRATGEKTGNPRRKRKNRTKRTERHITVDRLGLVRPFVALEVPGEVTAAPPARKATRGKR